MRELFKFLKEADGGVLYGCFLLTAGTLVGIGYFINKLIDKL